MIKPFVTSEAYTVYLEPAEMGWFIHCHVYEWNKTILKELQEILEDLFKLHKQPFYTVTDPTERSDEADLKKHRKFQRLLGGEHIANVRHVDGHLMELYKFTPPDDLCAQ